MPSSAGLAVALLVSVAAVPALAGHAPAGLIACTLVPGSVLTFDPPLTATPQSGRALLSFTSDLCGLAFIHPGCAAGQPCLAAGVFRDAMGTQVEEHAYTGNCAVATLDGWEPSDEFTVFAGTVANFRRANVESGHAQVLTLVLQPDAPCNVASAAVLAASYAANRD